MSFHNYATIFIFLGSTHLFYRIINNISSNMDNKLGIVINENTKLKTEINHIKERLTDLEAFRLKAYEKNISMMETRKWEENLDLDYDDEEDTYDDD